MVYLWFVLWPTLQAFQFSLTDWQRSLGRFRVGVGLDNYENLATNDSVFRKAVGNSLSFMLVVVIGQTVLSLALALALLRSSRLSIVLRALFFFPTVLSSVSVAFIWSFVYDPTFGLANRLLAAVGLGSLQEPWLGDQDMAIYYLAFVQTGSMPVR